MDFGQSLRDLAIGTLLGSIAAGIAAGTYGYFTEKDTPGEARRRLMRFIVACPDLPLDLALQLTTSRDPALLIRDSLKDRTLSDAAIVALRKALALTL